MNEKYITAFRFFNIIVTGLSLKYVSCLFHALHKYSVSNKELCFSFNNNCIEVCASIMRSQCCMEWAIQETGMIKVLTASIFN